LEILDILAYDQDLSLALYNYQAFELLILPEAPASKLPTYYYEPLSED
jgi:hypothetical protein